MDFSPIIEPVFSALWYLIPIVIIASIIQSPWFKGVLGEFWVNLGARLFLKKDIYHLIKNVTLPTPDGSTQIDHVIVSRYGVFVIETKNMKGWIFGGVKQKLWTQQIYKRKERFQNPLHQNYKHVKTLQELLDLSDEQVHSVVVFIGDCTFKTAMPENVTEGGEYISYIKSKKEIVFSEEDAQSIVEAIESGRLKPGFRTNREHVRHLKSREAARTNEITCPRCGSKMKLRTAKKGDNAGKGFWGCSTFPKCRTTIPLSEAVNDCGQQVG